MNKSSFFSWKLILFFGFGIGFGILFAWVIAPVEYVDAGPSLLRSDFKDQYRLTISAAYAANGDLARARARLALLNDPDVIQALSAQAQQMLANGESFEDVRRVAQLAADLQQGYPLIQTANPSGIAANTPPSTPVQSFEIVTPSLESLSVSPIIETPLPVLSATPRPTYTLTATPGAPLTLVGQDSFCDQEKSEGLMQVKVMDARHRQLAGIEIIVTWDGGEDRFFTGLKPELGDGYADFQMAPATVYSIRVVEGGTQVSSVIAPVCSLPNGGSYQGNLLLTFQQP